MPVREDTPRTTRMPRQARRAQLLVAAQEVFVSQGYHAAAMDDIADKAGVSKPVLYQHFPSKLDLYLALLDAGGNDLVATVKTAMASTRDNRLRVEAAVGAYFAFVDDSKEAFRLLFETDLFNEHAVRDRVQHYDEECADLLATVIAEDTGLDYDSATVLAIGLIGMAETSARRWLRRAAKSPATSRPHCWPVWRGEESPASRRIRSRAKESGPGLRHKVSAMSPAKEASSARKATASGSTARGTKSTGRTSVEIKIGIQQTPREIVLDVDQSAADIAKALTEAATKGATLVLNDVKGRQVLVQPDKIAYIEIGEPEARRVGFGGA